ncbi:hypothetical protein [Sphingobacterium sp. IITKGP-BTPF85]|uniref:hypothetical protein n=1 Tax=Sphingobacterium sp. IITKGP-BTPF85 TaxID=1338009 RepID=UPI00038A0913|nr:hypothetical protein [Sphingobacterium sp. IITKGP-BTPF85]KKX49320.1 hypothetical protein L950_0216155 [Sphingobacterium sp. IITKGP-BTPF85]
MLRFVLGTINNNKPLREKELNQLFAKFLRKECTEQELDLLFGYFADDQYEGELKKLIESNWSHDLSDDLDFQFKMRQSFLKTDAYLNKRINGAEEKGFFKKISDGFLMLQLACYLQVQFLCINFS